MGSPRLYQTTIVPHMFLKFAHVIVNKFTFFFFLNPVGKNEIGPKQRLDTNRKNQIVAMERFVEVRELFSPLCTSQLRTSGFYSSILWFDIYLWFKSASEVLIYWKRVLNSLINFIIKNIYQILLKNQRIAIFTFMIFQSIYSQW